MKTFANGEAVILRGRVESCMSREDAPPAMQTYAIILEDGQRVQTNLRNLVPANLPEAPPEAPDLVPVSFYTQHEDEPKPKARKSKPPHNARLPREGF